MRLRGTFKRECISLVILFAALFLVGVTVGAFISVKVSQSELEAFRSALRYSAEHSADNPFKTAKQSLLSVIVFAVLVWLSGFFPLSVKLITDGTVIIYKGTLVGYTVGLLSRTYAFMGLGIAAVSILPQYILLLPLIFYLSVNAIQFERKNINNKVFYKYFVLFTVSVFVCVVAAVTDAFVTGNLLKLFVLYI